MADVPIQCPFCHKSFKLNETLAAPLIDQTRRRLEEEFKEKERGLDLKRKALAEEQAAAEKNKKEIEQAKEANKKDREEIQQVIDAQLKQQRAILEREAESRAKRVYDEKLAAQAAEKLQLEEAMRAKDQKLAEAQKAQIEALRKQRELDAKMAELDLTAEKKAAELVGPQLEKAKRDFEETTRLKLLEQDKVIEKLHASLQDALRKAEQGSQQQQGDTQEIDLERRLREAFPLDSIERVPKGYRGSDLVHVVLTPNGMKCGTILWESKRTKKWENDWIDKLKEDQRTAKADLAIIVTQSMPKGIDTFGELDRVWVANSAFAVPIAALLRLGLMDVANARRASENQHDKMSILYRYLTGPEFRRRLETIVDAFNTMRADLEKERQIITKQWEGRFMLLNQAMVATVGLYADVQAIAGKTLPEIKGLEFDSLE